MKKYGIIILCNDTGEYNNVYVDNIPKLFDTKENAEKVLQEQLLDECQSLNEDSDDSVLYMDTYDNEIWYEIDINGIYIPQHWVSKYMIMEWEI